MRQRVVLDVARLVAQPLEFGQPVGGGLALLHEAALHLARARLQLFVGERPRAFSLNSGEVAWTVMGSPGEPAGIQR